jgi:ribosomal protein S4
MSSYAIPKMLPRTFFQQKWAAKAMMRAYHGEHVREREWTRMFKRRLDTVVNMDPEYMAKYDGSEQATGRGSGRHTKGPVARFGDNKLLGDIPTPYMQMAFAPMERRLDIAIFRAMFASSARQARQLVIHGAVKVNGVKVRAPRDEDTKTEAMQLTHDSKR